MEDKYKAIATSHELREILGAQCSPMQGRSYVIGPDINNRLCHVATCYSHGDAIRRARELNRVKKELKRRT